MHMIIFVKCLFIVEIMGKILNLLFDTFQSTKYFHASFPTLACHFCVGSFTYPIAMKILW
jgi:hypothetical protein